jgi:hypothetical protein
MYIHVARVRYMPGDDRPQPKLYCTVKFSSVIELEHIPHAHIAHWICRWLCWYCTSMPTFRRSLITSVLGQLVMCMSRKPVCWVGLSIGVATIPNKKTLFVTLVDLIPRFEAYCGHFFAEFDWFVVLTSRSDAWISRSGDFLDNYNDATTDYFTPLRMRAG